LLPKIIYFGKSSSQFYYSNLQGQKMSAYLENVKAAAVATHRRLLNRAQRFRTTNRCATSAVIPNNLQQSILPFVDRDNDDGGEGVDDDFDWFAADQQGSEFNSVVDEDDGSESPPFDENVDENSDRDSVNMDDAPNIAEDEIFQFGVRDIHEETNLKYCTAENNRTLTKRVMDIVYPRVEVLVS
jgi:hypothetical protein